MGPCPFVTQVVAIKWPHFAGVAPTHLFLCARDESERGACGHESLLRAKTARARHDAPILDRCVLLLLYNFGVNNFIFFFCGGVVGESHKYIAMLALPAEEEHVSTPGIMETGSHAPVW